MTSSDELAARFSELYGFAPEVRITCPGRVNLIGEHIDYHDYSVFPMAIDASTTILAARNTSSDSIVFTNVDPRYEPWTSDIPCGWKGSSRPKWFDYLLAGWKGILDSERVEQFGMVVLLSGNIPPSSGLSSSSSLVCASAFATLSLIHVDPFAHISKEDFAHLCANSEPLIGTLSGGMDQAAEVLASEGSALKIDFNPLRSKNISLPDDAVFVVVHSNTELNKAATTHYNERVIEGRIVAQLLKKTFGLETSSFRLKEVHRLSGKSFDEMLAIVEEKIPEEVTKEDVVKLIGEEKLEECLTENTRSFTHFKLRSRARHVFSEALRVEQFEKACEQKNIREMGRLMNESHRSCAVDYECSCAELDEICRLYLANGALGARLTGAGWGGCAVVLFEAADVAKAAHLPSLFVSKPAQGIRLHRYE